jgi:pyruvate dehydrogenase E2 component (dihydrolipoamide acetyltransferase)
LLAPVIHDADGKDLDVIMEELRDLVTRARRGRLRGSEVAGATLTVTDLGEHSVDSVTPIIHPPQVAIVGLGAIRDVAWAVDGLLGVHPVVHATLAGDHRVSDGRVGAQMLTSLDRLLQEELT